MCRSVCVTHRFCHPRRWKLDCWVPVGMLATLSTASLAAARPCRCVCGGDCCSQPQARSVNWPCLTLPVKACTPRLPLLLFAGPPPRARPGPPWSAGPSRPRRSPAWCLSWTARRCGRQAAALGWEAQGGRGWEGAVDPQRVAQVNNDPAAGELGQLWQPSGAGLWSQSVPHTRASAAFPLVAAQVKQQMAVVDKTNDAVESFARVDFHPECEAAINEQISASSTLLALQAPP